MVKSLDDDDDSTDGTLDEGGSKFNETGPGYRLYGESGMDDQNLKS